MKLIILKDYLSGVNLYINIEQIVQVYPDGKDKTIIDLSSGNTILVEGDLKWHLKYIFRR